MITVRRVIDYLAFLACAVAGIAMGFNHQPELAVSLIILSGLVVIASDVSDLRRDVQALRERGSSDKP